MGRGGRAPIRGGATAHLMGRGSLLSYSCFVSPFQAEARRPAPGTAVHRYLSSKPALEFKYVEATPGWERADCWVNWTRMDLPRPEKVD